MTEYLLNWAPNGTVLANVQPFSWASQGFDFAKAINACMLADVSAWIHYSAKRYYGMIGDGYGGTVNGEITKRGYILAQYAKYVTGATRIENTWTDSSNTLDGSAYLSATGDSIMVVVINPSNNSYSLTVNLPVSAASGKSITTTETADMAEAAIDMPEKTANPEVSVSALSVTTLIFSESGAVNTGLTHIKNTPTVLSEEYYTLLGQRAYPVNNNTKGIYIVRSLMSDGSVKSRKIFIH
jgi:glucuronoarabinoxylan endo-1,4-beta-xylanase